MKSEEQLAAPAPYTKSPTTADLVERLKAHKTLGEAPIEELSWLATHGEFQTMPAGHALVRKGQQVDEMWILFTGNGAVYIDRGAGSRKTMEWQGGEVTGLLPFSRLTSSIGDAFLDAPTEALLIRRHQFPELIRECPTVLAALVHTMLDRARTFASTDWQDEKLVSLGRLAAGLAHELNNPASAAVRSAKLLTNALTEAHEASHALGGVHLTDDQLERVQDLRDQCLMPVKTGIFSALDRSDREEEITSWLEKHGADDAPAAALVESCVTIGALDDLIAAVPRAAFDAALRWIAAEFNARSLATNIERATGRIHDLVSSVKRFTYMDRATVATPTDIGQSIADTIAVLAAKARAKSVAVTLDIPSDLPRVPAYPAELNQVWSNLIENALDAVGTSGHVSVSAQHLGGPNLVLVSVVDDGHGIPAEIKARIFDPFFTTKPIGEGSGLGLGISDRIVRRHNGHIEVESRPSHTEFRVTLPAGSAARPSTP
jgi:signal transduction histidine kinase